MSAVVTSSSSYLSGGVSQWKSALSSLQSGRCFYGDDHEMSAPEVDHFLPWAFVLEDRTWNLVLACRQCNNSKRDSLPSMDMLTRMLERNAEISPGASAPDTHFSRHFDEWRSRDLAGHLRSLYDQAAMDGFPPWRSDC